MYIHVHVYVLVGQVRSLQPHAVYTHHFLYTSVYAKSTGTFEGRGISALFATYLIADVLLPTANTLQ